MKRANISVILILALFVQCLTTLYPPQVSCSSSEESLFSPMGTSTLAQAGNSGNQIPVVQYMQRQFPDQLLSISNSYASTGSHNQIIDLSSYQISGWTLHKVIIEVDNITANAEREIVGTTVSPSYGSGFGIYEKDDDFSMMYINQLAQGFYNMPHDGQLQNLSLLYNSPTYDPPNHNYAYIDLRSDYQNGSTKIVSSVQLGYVGLTATWANVIQTAVLDASTTYYAVLNGTKLLDPGIYPKIYWYYQNGAGAFLTRRYDTEFSSWGSDSSYEAILNYTYIPWNKTSNSALVYSNPNTIDLKINGSSTSGTSWTISSATNITSLEVSTNQSVNIFHNLTLCYTHDVSANTVWKADVSASPIMWNVTIDLVYPSVPETISRFMNITSVLSDWTATGLYLGTSPSGSYSKIGSIVHCSELSDGTWTLTATAPNYVTDIALSDSFDSSPIGEYVSILIDIDIDASIEDGVGTPITGGLTNLTVIQGGQGIYKPVEIAASGGIASFTWDIDSTTLGNGTYYIEVFWSNGFEAGYFVTQVFVYYPTTLVADDLVLNAYADNATGFDIGVNFDQDFPVRGLDDSLADVTYSFDGGANTSLNDQTGGRWTGTVPTTGKSSGIYQLLIYAEGYALENQSLAITVNLVYKTRTLNWSWSNTNNITYTASTNLSISYLMDDGITRISGATVNVSIQGTIYDMTWDPLSETYWIEFTGQNFTGVPGTFALDVLAWKAGYEVQSNNSIMITIRSEVTGLTFNVDYNPTSLNISYIESLFIQVTYNFNSVPINENTIVRVLFNGSSPVNLVYNTISMKWETTLLGSDYLGAWSIIVRATADGYLTQENTTVFVVYEDTPILSSSWMGSASITDYDTLVPFSITLTMSNSTPINDATVSFTAFSIPYTLSTGIAGVYTFSIDPNATRGVESFTVTVVRTGYLTCQMNLELTVQATTEISINTLSNEYEQCNLTITVTYSDSPLSTPITGATVIMTLDGVGYTLVYSGGFYVIEIVLDVAPGVYTLSVSATAPLANAASDAVQLTVDPKRAVYLELVSEGDPSSEGQLVSITATLRYNDTGNPVIGVNIYFIVRITFANGTVLVRDSPTQYDSTNTNGVAQWSFYVPAGNIESIEAEAHYYGSRQLWSAQKTIVVGGTSPLIALLFFFFGTTMGQIVISSIVLVGFVTVAYNRRIKPKKRAAKTSLENQLQMFVDLESLRHFMAIYLDRGTCVFYHPFTDERIQPDLISGFIAAITSVYGEIKGDGVRGTLEEIQYHGLRLNSYSGDKIIGILILEGEMTPLLKDRLQFFVELFENQYEMDLDGWTGLVDCFDPEWIVSTLNSAFNYSWLLPHRFGPTQKVSKTDAKILDYIAAVRDDRGEFYIRHLLSPVSEMLDLSEAQVVDRLLALQERGAIVPVGVQTVLQRQGMGLSDGREGKDDFTLELPRTSETSDELEEEPKPVRRKKTTPKPKEVTEEPTPEPEVEPIAAVDEVVEEPSPEPEPKEEIDPMEAFVMDVESLLSSREEKDSDTEKEEED